MYQSIDCDVIIIGAGVSGCTAAYTFFEKDPSLNILIIEANDFAGGRTLSTPLLIKDGTGLASFDLGAERIYSDQEVLLKLLKKLQIDIIPIKERGKVILDFKKNHFSVDRMNMLHFLNKNEKSDLNGFIIKINVCCSKINNVNSLKDFEDKNMESFLNENIKSEAVKKILRNLILKYLGVPPSRTSLLFYVFYCATSRSILEQIFPPENLQAYVIKGGAQSICEKIIKIIGKDSLIKNNRVEEIVQKENYIRVITDENEYCCHYVITAIQPKSILKISFKPSLPATKINAINNTNSGIVIKFIVTYPKAFWLDKNFSGEIYQFSQKYSKENPIQYCSDITVMNNPALTGFIFSEEVVEWKNHVLAQLSRIFGNEALEPTTYFQKVWDADSGGFMSCWSTNNAAFIQECKRTINRVHFAGSDTTIKWYGSMAGAVNSGIRSSLEVLYYIKPNSLEASELEEIKFFEEILIPSELRKNSFSPSNILNWKILVPISLVCLYLLYRFKFNKK